jgi:hypothetical protein
MPTAALKSNPSASMPHDRLSREEAIRIEKCETEAWLDLYAAAPADFAKSFGLAIETRDGVTATFCKTIPFIHFNSVMDMGLDTAATAEEIDAWLARYAAAGIKAPWFYHSPHCLPAEMPQWLIARGFRQRGGWDRIWRDAAALPPQYEQVEGGIVERVTAANAREWAGFIDAAYGLPTSPWLLALVGRPGWRHYILRREQKIQAVRSLFVGPGGLAWSGIEAPVPGIMAPSFEDDARIVETMVRDGLAAGARLFAADIEAPLAGMDGPAYENFARLGFRKAYFRQHYGV